LTVDNKLSIKIDNVANKVDLIKELNIKLEIEKKKFKKEKMD